jgi:hypothetical protein
MMDVRIRELHSWSGLIRYMVEAKRESGEKRIFWLPLASFVTLESAIAWCLGRDYNIIINVGDDKWIEVEHLELSN